MTPPDVAELLAAIPRLKWSSGPYGFTLQATHGTIRIERGSGIAGRGGHWGLVDIPSGQRTKLVSSRRELERLIWAWMDGPRWVAPWRDVVTAEPMPGWWNVIAKGKPEWFVTASCGHSMTRRATRPPKRVRCPGCEMVQVTHLGHTLP